MLFGNYNTDQASTYTPQIISTIGDGVEKLIALGATDIVVPGVLPIGCFPIYLTIYGTSSAADYDSLGCLKKFNDLSTNHNNQLQTKISSLQSKYKSARIMYADFYSGVYDMVRSPSKYGTLSVPGPTRLLELGGYCGWLARFQTCSGLWSLDPPRRRRAEFGRARHAWSEQDST
jgi:phospholipase/lecithinase/hemolysin